MRKDSFAGIVIALAAVVAWTTPSVAADRLVVRVNEPFEVNGDIFPAGRLSLKQVQVMSPGSTLHEARIDGESLGLLLVRDNGSKAVATRDEMVFLRSANGHLVLESLSIAGRPVGRVYTYRADAGQWYASSGAPRPIEVASLSGN
jgi:hypothetical protein